MYKACIFDLDGTLTDTLESLTYSVNETLKELNLSEISSEQCKAFVGHGARYLIEQALIASGDKKLEHIEEAMSIYARIFKVNCTYHVAPYEGIADMLNVLKEAGVKLAVLSNKPHVQTVSVVTSFFEEGLFSHVQGQVDGVPRKPDPTAAWMIAEKLQVEKEACVYVGDSDVDMLTANAAGMVSVGVTWGFRPKQVLLENGAEHAIDYPEELISIIKQKE